MRKIHLVLVMLLILIPSLTVVFLHFMLARENPLPNNQGRVVAEATEGPIKLVMELNKTIYNIGENVSITIKVVNISNSTIELGWSTPSLAMFTVYDQQNRKIYNSARVTHVPMAVEKQLEPGESWEVPQIYWMETPAIWNQRDDEGKQVPLGTYHIIAEIPTPYGSLIVNGEKTHAKTPILTITISG